MTYVLGRQINPAWLPMWGFFVAQGQAQKTVLGPIPVDGSVMRREKMMNTRLLIATLLTLPLLQACTVLAIADVAASTVIYGVKTVVNVVDAVTPDIINKDKKKD